MVHMSVGQEDEIGLIAWHSAPFCHADVGRVNLSDTVARLDLEP
jgi:hypothetical protein